MLDELKQGVRFTLVTMGLLGGLYHLGLWGMGRALFPVQAEGSLVRRADGTVAGSRLIAQPFIGREYFTPRPSAVGYDAASTGGTNAGPSNPDHLEAVRQRLASITAAEAASPSSVPSDMLTASGSGVDPHVSPPAALLQAARVAAARGVPVERVRELIGTHTEPPTLGVLGRPRVNVLELNLALDGAFGRQPPTSQK